MFYLRLKTLFGGSKCKACVLIWLVTFVVNFIFTTGVIQILIAENLRVAMDTVAEHKV